MVHRLRTIRILLLLGLQEEGSTSYNDQAHGNNDTNNSWGKLGHGESTLIFRDDLSLIVSLIPSARSLHVVEVAVFTLQLVDSVANFIDVVGFLKVVGVPVVLVILLCGK